jgi:hypothetical protein
MDDAQVVQPDAKDAEIASLTKELQIAKLRNQLAANGAKSMNADRDTDSHAHRCQNCKATFFYPVPRRHDAKTYVQNATAGCPACGSTLGFDVYTHDEALASRPD